MEVNYPETWPNLVISCLSKNIPWVRGDANFTGQVNGVIGNTNFGYDESKAILIKPTEVKANTVLSFNADNVKGLDSPKYFVWLLNSDNKLIPYTIEEDSITIPHDEGEYLYHLLVDWGKGDNTISYWFKVKVVKY
ncbi:hypothetical protein N752_09380 [Desulforamulus aquiferis]|nr:hypothetical protein [Desulforamulus aquiferis]RYD05547.1 hypothetical protein N752_09380 [Desulforamulus aquiferis]